MTRTSAASGTHHVARVVLLGAAMVALSACMPRTVSVPADAETGATVRVDNRSSVDARIYVFRGSQRIRLGIASPVGLTTLRIPRELVTGDALRFFIEPIGSPRAGFSEEIVVWPGDEVQLRIPTF